MSSTVVGVKRSQKQILGDEVFELLQFNRKPGKIKQILTDVEEGKQELDFQQKYERGNTLLDEAIKSSDSFRNSETFIEIAIKLIQLDKDNYMIGYINPNGAFKGTTPLIIACYRKLGKIALEMIKKGEACNPSYQEPELQFTALMYACWSCRAEVAIELMKIITPESMCLISHTGNTALMYACSRIDLTDVKETIVIKEIISVMKQKCPELIGHVDHDGYTALMIMCKTFYAYDTPLQKEQIELIVDALIQSGNSNPGYVNKLYSEYGNKQHCVTSLILSVMNQNYPAAIKLAELPDANVDYIVRNDPFVYAEESFDNTTAFDILLSLLEDFAVDAITPDQTKLFNLLMGRYYNYKNSDNAELSTLSDRYIRVCCNNQSLKQMLIGYFDSKVNGKGETMVKALCENRSKLGNLVATNALPIMGEPQPAQPNGLMRPLEVTDSQGRADTVSESPMQFFSVDEIQRMSKVPRLTAQQSYPTAQPIVSAYMRPASPSPDDFGQDPRTLQYSDRDGYLRITGPKNPDEDNGPSGGRKYTKRKKSNRRTKKSSTKRKRKSRKFK
jgi:hypothetical protein